MGNTLNELRDQYTPTETSKGDPRIVDLIEYVRELEWSAGVAS